MRIIVFINAANGCILHRLIIPYRKMAELNKNFQIDFFVPKAEQTEQEILNIISTYDYFVFNRTMNIDLLAKIKKLGVKVICDNDDDWILGQNHPLYLHYKQNGISEIIKLCMEMSDIVTTTTDYLADKIRKVNKNVFVLPNALCSEGQFAKIVTKEKRLRFGLIGSSSHTDDMRLLDGIITQLHYYDPSLIDKIQFVLCGFDKGKVNVYDARTGQKIREEEVLPKDTCWGDWERNLTNNYSTLSPSYAEFLQQYNNRDVITFEEPYVRLWTKDIFEYANLYNCIDVLLVPLQDNEFNHSKSPLKLVEASVKGKAVICSNVEPYSKYLVNGENCISINKRKGIRGWVEAIAKLVNEPEFLEHITNGLAELTAEGAEFNLEKVSKDRIELFNVVLPKLFDK